MKFAYLMYFDHCKSNEICAILRELIKQSDHVFVMINDVKTRDAVTLTFLNDPRVHISHNQEYCQEGDMSLARGTLLQMKDAIETEGVHFDYYINLPEGMLPVKTRRQIVSFLSDSDTDFYYIDRTEKEDPSLRKKTLKYYPYTSLLNFPDNRRTRARTQHMASFLSLFGIRRRLPDLIEIGSPWFILKPVTVQVLTEHFAYCSEYFKLSWYCEENIIPMMIHRFLGDARHINQDLRAVGPTGRWQESQGIRLISKDVLDRNPQALFAGRFSHDEDPDLFNEVLDRYNRDENEETAVSADPDQLKKMVDTISEHLAK